MKTRLACIAPFILALGVMLSALPTWAGIVYDNGPINGDSDGWTINFGLVVSDSFTVSAASSTITGLSFGVWLFPGDTLTTVEVSLTSEEFGGTVYFDQPVAFTTSNCGGNSYGYNICMATGTFNGPSLTSGTYWLNLQNATLNNGDPAYWDENSGQGCTSPGCPSSASENSVGTIPSEDFTLYGNINGTVPEPGSLLLLSSGIAAVAAVVRRKLL